MQLKRSLSHVYLQCQVNPESGEPQDELSAEAVEFCRKLGSNATHVSDIAGGRDRTINAAIQEGINRVNEKATSNAQRIQKWVILDRDFSISGGELGEWAELQDLYRAHAKSTIQWTVWVSHNSSSNL